MDIKEVCARIATHVDNLPYPAHLEVKRVFETSYQIAYAVHRGLVASVTTEGEEWIMEMVQDLISGWESGPATERIIVPAAVELSALREI